METANAQHYEHVGFEGLFDFSFRKFITLGVVKVRYILLLVLAGIFWLGGVVPGFSQGAGAGLLAIIVMTLLAVIQVITWRVLLELVVMIFRIGDNTARLSPGAETPSVIKTSRDREGAGSARAENRTRSLTVAARKDITAASRVGRA